MSDNEFIDWCNEQAKPKGYVSARNIADRYTNLSLSKESGAALRFANACRRAFAEWFKAKDVQWNKLSSIASKSGFPLKAEAAGDSAGETLPALLWIAGFRAIAKNGSERQILSLCFALSVKGHSGLLIFLRTGRQTKDMSTQGTADTLVVDIQERLKSNAMNADSVMPHPTDGGAGARYVIAPLEDISIHTDGASITAIRVNRSGTEIDLADEVVHIGVPLVESNLSVFGPLARLSTAPDQKDADDEYDEENQPVNADKSIDRLVNLAKKYGQVILYGPPGTGKTRLAREVAAKLLEEHLQNLPDALRTVVFHPAYEYDQFIGGLRPNVVDGNVTFEVVDGAFTALAKLEGAKVLIIDEINRGNLPKLLGELLYALEYRGEDVYLSYRPDTKFQVPKDLYVIGTMNSSDRSIGLIDVAIRRRFAFMLLLPDADVVETEWERNFPGETLGPKMRDLMNEINAELKLNGDSQEEMGVGHSYFLPPKDGSANSPKALEKHMQLEWTYRIRPLLSEYHEMGLCGTPVKELPTDPSKPFESGKSGG